MAFVTFFPSGSGGGGGGNNDRFAPKYLVGNVPNGDTASAAGLAAGFTYFADTGNGAGIAAALAAAALVPGDVWIRPGSYNLGLAGAPAAGFIVPSGVRVSGSGQGTVIVPPLNGFQTVFTLSDTAELNDLRIPLIGVLAGTNPNPGVIQAQGGVNSPCWIRRVDVQLDREPGSTGPTRCAVYLATGVLRMESCRFFLNESDPQSGTGGTCALFADGNNTSAAFVTQCSVSGNYDSGFVATEDPSLFLSETRITGANLAGVLTSSGEAPAGQVTISECSIDVTANGTAVDVGSDNVRLVNSRLGPNSGAPVGAALISTCARGVVVGNQINGNVDTSNGTNHIIVTNLISSASVLTTDPTDEIAHNIAY